MGLFNRRGGVPVPAWWQHKRGDWTEFVDLLTSALNVRNVAFEEHFAEGFVSLEGGANMGLHNLTANWSQIPKGSRKEVLEAFLDAGLSALRGASSTSVDRTALRISLYPKEEAEVMTNMAHKWPCESFLAVAMLDLVGAARALRPSDLEASEISEDEAFETAVGNVWQFEGYNVDRLPIEGLGQIHIVYGDSMYTAANVLHLERFVNPACEHGVVFAVPNRHFFAFVRTDEPGFSALLEHLARLAMKHVRDEYPVSADLVWWKDGVMRRIGGPEADRYGIGMPKELAEMMQARGE